MEMHAHRLCVCYASLLFLTTRERIMRNMLAALGIVLALLLMGGGAAVFAQGYFTEDTITGAIAPETVKVNENESSENSSSKSKTVVYELEPVALSGSKAIRIFLRQQRAYLMQGGVVVKTYQISSGAPKTPTPTGTFRIYKKQDLRVSSLEVPYRMPHYMAFTPNEAFGLHGLPYLGRAAEDSAYWREARAHIGIPVSHGCIRFLPEEAAEIYEWADVGTPVFIRI